LAVTTILDRHPDYTWSTGFITDTPAAQAFWAAIGLRNTGNPVTCRHMRAVDEPDTPRKSLPPSWFAPRR
jgi:hypothetical protein